MADLAALDDASLLLVNLLLPKLMPSMKGVSFLPLGAKRLNGSYDAFANSFFSYRVHDALTIPCGRPERRGGSRTVSGRLQGKAMCQQTAHDESGSKRARSATPVA